MTDLDVRVPAPARAGDRARVSVLYPSGAGFWTDVEEPGCFTDLNLGQIEAQLRRICDSPAIEPAFRSWTTDREVLDYRLDTFDDFQDSSVETAVSSFSEAIRTTRRLLKAASRTSYRHAGEGLRLEAIAGYTDAVTALRDALAQHRPASAALRAVADFLDDYCGGESFTILSGDNQQLTAELGEVHYAIRVRSGKFTVTPQRYTGDYSSEVLATFERFRQTDAADHLAKLPEAEMNHIEAVILDFVAQQNPELFDRVAAHLRRQSGFLHPVVDQLEQEFEFYLCYRKLMAQMQRVGVTFCRPAYADDENDHRLSIRGGCDLALALKGRPVVANDLTVGEDQSSVIVTGPNQGGKTTFARMAGEICYLAGIGCPVPATSVVLRPPDRILTHFERQEDRERETAGGGLEDDLERIHDLLRQADNDTLLIINEMFASTTLADAAYLGDKILQQLERRGTTTVWVSFVEALARRNDRTISMVAQTARDDPATRTFQVAPQPPAGKIYAEAIAARHGLRRQDVLDRIPEPGQASGQTAQRKD